MKVRFLPSDQVLAELSNQISKSKDLKFAVAFAKESGYNLIRSKLQRQLNKGAKCDFVVGISSYGITDCEVLKDLLKTSNSNNRLRARSFNDEGFHPKLFIFSRGKLARIIIGSSNLTGGGIKENVEANLLVEGKKTEPVIKDILRFFENEVFHKSDKLDRKTIEEYERYSKKFRKNRRLKYGIPKTPIERPSGRTIIKRLRGRKFWKVAPGERGCAWSEWENNIDRGSRGIIGIGWAPLNLVNLPFEDMIRSVKIVGKKLRKERYDSSSKYVAKQALYLSRTIKRGDIIAVYSNKCLYAICEVIKGLPFYDSRFSYPNVRKVKYLAVLNEKLPKKQWKLLATEDTIHEITDQKTIELLKEKGSQHNLYF